MVVATPRFADRVVERLQDRSRVIQEHLAAGQQLHAARAALEQRHADLVLERLDLATERRLRDVKTARRLTRGARVGDGDEVAQLIEAHRTIKIARARETSGSDTQSVLAAGSKPTQVAGMAVSILSLRDVAGMRVAGEIASATLAHVGARLRPGITTADIDRWVRVDTHARGGRPSQLGYKGFPASVCTSRNEVVCHGIPSERVTLADGDIVNVDVTSHIGGYHGDTSCTFFVGTPSVEAKHVVDVARRCRDAGIAVVRDGIRLGDIGHAIEQLAEREGCSVVRDFGGHGIGHAMHLDPHIPHHGRPGTGRRLRAGMAFTIEPMINLGGPEVHVLDDGWTVVTTDGALSAQFEHTLVVTKRGCEITTRA
jgi:methionyl aminopeptidase